MKFPVRHVLCFLLAFSWLGFADQPDAGKRPDDGAVRTAMAAPEAHPELWLIGYQRSVPRSVRTDLHRASGMKVVHAFKNIPVEVVRMIDTDPDLRAAKLAVYRGCPEIRYIEPNYRLTKAMLPNDPMFGSLWGLNNTGQEGGVAGADIGITNVWATHGAGSTSIVVAVIDTGIDYTHEDLAANVWINPEETANGLDDDGNGIVDDLHGARWTGGDGVPTSGDPMDGDGHGTHVSGTIGGVGQNSLGVAGVNWQVRIMALKFLDDSGSGWTADAVSALDYAVSKGARLSNNSWGGGGFSQALKDAIDLAASSNHLFVAAAGNSAADNDAMPSYPASYASSNIIAVASSDRNDEVSSFSNYGRTSVHLAAPGSDILSSVPGNGYEIYSGTSMATPHVAGACALLWSIYPDASYESIMAAIVHGVTRKPVWANRTISGGRLHVGESVRLAGLPSEVVPVEPFVASGSQGDDAIQLAWTLPGGAEGVIIRADTNGYPATWNQGRAVYSGLSTTHEDGGLTDGMRYYYSAWAWFVDGTTTSFSAAASAQARVGGDPDDYFTELFEQFDNDLAFTTVTFMPSSSLNGYEAFTDPATVYPDDPVDGTPLVLDDDGHEQITLSGDAVLLYGQSYTQLFVGANGYLTFDEGDTTYSESLTSHFSLPRVSGIFDDLNPSLGGTISWKSLSNRVVITFDQVPEYGNPLNLNNFQIELFFAGTIRITWLDIASRDGLAGLSAGEGVPFNFAASDLTDYPSTDPLRVQPRTGVVFAGVEGGPFLSDPVVYTLTNAGEAALTWVVAESPSWLDVSVVTGALNVGSSMEVEFSVDASAASLAFGEYESSVIFSNRTSGRAHIIPATLRVYREDFTALYFMDGSVREDFLLPALYGQGYQVTVADDWSMFNRELTNVYKLVAAMTQFGEMAVDQVALAEHIAEGGWVVANDWTHNTNLVALLEASYTGATDLSPAELLDTDLAAGVVNPVALADPGYGFDWSVGLMPTGEGQALARFPNNDAALVWGHGGRTALLGFLIDTVPSSDARTLFENLLDLLELGFDDLRIQPQGDFLTTGYELGPFTPDHATYSLHHAGTGSLAWTASVVSDWVQLGASNGTLLAGDTFALEVSLTPAAAALIPGDYFATLMIGNDVSGKGFVRTARLTVRPRPGEISIFDSIAPTNDLHLPYDEVTVGRSRTESVTVMNVDATYDLLLNGAYVMSERVGEATNTLLRPKVAASAVMPVRPVIDWSQAHVPDSLLVGFDAGTAKAARDQFHASAGTVRLRRYGLVPVDVVEVPKGQSLKELVIWYEQQPGVAYAEPNYIVHAEQVPDDPRFGELWGLHNDGQLGGTPGADIGALDAWAISTGNSNVIVGIIDTGIDYTHADLAANVWCNPGEISGNGLDDDGNGIIDDVHGARWVDGSGLPVSGDPMDGNSHGTHVAGTIGAVGDNGVGVVGINWTVRLMALKFLDDSGSGSTADAIAALEYAVDKGAHLSNNSWGGGGYSQALKDAIDAAGVANQLFIAAAGNDGTDNDALPHYPSSYASDTIIAVASSDRFDARSSFSCFGAQSVDLAAPGSAILSTTPGDTYAEFNGTSMATPHVAGAAALLLGMNPGADALLIKEALMNSVDVIPAWEGRTISGGRLNLAAALGFLNPHYRVSGLPALPTRLVPGASLTFDVTYAPVEPGEHEAWLVLTSNATNQPLVEVSLTGTGAADALVISPEVTFVVTGFVGEAVAVASHLYTMTNTGAQALPWTVAPTSAWLSASATSGTLAPAASTVVTVSVVQSVIDGLPVGTYRETLIFSNTLSGVVHPRPVRLDLAMRLCAAVEACELPWTTGGGLFWEGQSLVSHDGVDAAQSGAITDGQTTWIETVVTGPGRLSFWWKVSSESGYDYLQVLVNGDVRRGVTGEVSWEKQRLDLASGVNTVRWQYVKDNSISDGDDRAWLDEVAFGMGPDGFDHAGLYTAGTFTNRANRGQGFESWEITNDVGAVSDLYSSTPASGNINSTNNIAFRLYGGPAQTYANAIRPFAAGLASGDVFRATIAYNWNGGARGLNILAADYSELANVNFGGGDTLSFKWGNGGTETLSTSWSATATLFVTVTQLNGDQLAISIQRNDGQSWTRTSSGLWAPAGMVKFYNGGHPAGNVNYALFVNDLRLERVAGPDVDGDGLPDWWELKHFGSLYHNAEAQAANPAYSLRQIYIADLDPTDTDASFPPADAVQVPGGLMHLVIDPSSTARVYRVQASTNLLQGVWPSYTGMKTGTGGALSFTVTNDAPGRIYRTGVALPE